MRYFIYANRLIKVCLERRGPVTVSQVGQRFFSGQDVPLRTFSCPRHTLSRPVHWFWAEQEIINTHISLLTACLCLETHTKQKLHVQVRCKHVRTEPRFFNCMQLLFLIYLAETFPYNRGIVVVILYMCNVKILDLHYIKSIVFTFS